MLIGKMNKLLVFYAPTTSQDAYGQQQETWKKSFERLGSVNDIKAAERFNSTRELNVHTTKMYVRYSDDIKTDMRINYKTMWFKIDGIAIISNEEGLEITASEVDQNTNFKG